MVTGAASGIGLATAAAFVAAGMRVVMADITADRLRVEAERVGGHAVVVDVADPESVEALADATVERFGTVHVVMNNAGVVSTGNSWEQSLDEWRRVLDVNLWGVIHGIPPSVVADRIVEAIVGDEPYVFTDRYEPDAVAARLHAILDAVPREGSAMLHPDAAGTTESARRIQEA